MFGYHVANFTPLGALLNHGLPGQDDILLQATSRSGRNMVGTATTLPILLPHLRVKGGGNWLRYGTTGTSSAFFDIAENNITLCGWVNIPTGVTIVANTGLLFGKISTSTSRSGTYGFRINATTGYLESKIISSAGTFLVASEITAVGSGWHFLRMEVNQSTLKHSFWIDENLIASSDYTGTFSALSEFHGFFVGGGTVSASTESGTAEGCFSDVYLFKKVLSEAEGAALLAGSLVTGAAFHCALNEYNFNDLSGNEHHLIPNAVNSNVIQIEYREGEKGAMQGLTIGYSEYISLKGLIIHIPYADDSEPLASPSLPAGAVFVKNVAGVADAHNLFDSCIEIDNAAWDRSTTALFNAQARLTGTQYAISANDRSLETYYIPTRPKAWHISELNQQNIYNYLIEANATNETDKFVKIDVNSISNRQKLLEIVTYDAALSEADSEKALTYTGDKAIINNHSLSYVIDTVQISAKRGLKILRFVEATNTLSLSVDGGETTLRSLQVLALSGIVTFAHIFENGNILFASQDKMYLSDDSLQTYAETTVLDVAGDAFVAGTVANFMPFIYDKNHADSLPLVWGNYVNPPSTAPASIWYTADQGATVKQAFLFGTSQIGGNTISVRHVHSVTYCAFDDSYYICTGDNTTECYFIKGVYDSDNDTWAFTIAATSDNYGAFKGCNLTYYDGNFYWASDSSALGYMGIMRCAYADLGDVTKTVRIYKSGEEFTSLQLTDSGHIIAVGHLYGFIVTSLDRVNFKVTKIPATYGELTTGFIIAHPDDGNGNFIAQLYPSDKELYTIPTGAVAILSIDI